MKANLTLVLYGKKATTKEGKTYTRYFTTMPTGEVVNVKFAQPAKEPNMTPCDILITKAESNMATKTYTKQNDEGVTEQRETKTLWLKGYTFLGEHVDTSMDEYFNEDEEYV